MTKSNIAHEMQRVANRLPLVLTILALFVMIAAQTFQSARARGTLQTLFAGQETTMQNALKLRHEMEFLAGKTATLAAQGDEGAKSVVAEMKQQGVVLTAPPQQ
jgi:hypothetical protein